MTLQGGRPQLVNQQCKGDKWETRKWPPKTGRPIQLIL